MTCQQCNGRGTVKVIRSSTVFAPILYVNWEEQETCPACCGTGTTNPADQAKKILAGVLTEDVAK